MHNKLYAGFFLFGFLVASFFFVLLSPFSIDSHGKEVVDLIDQANGSIVIVIGYGGGYNDEVRKNKKSFHVDIKSKLSKDLTRDFVENKWKEFQGVMFNSPDHALKMRGKIMEVLSSDSLGRLD